MDVPYLHRFGVISTDRGCWIVLAVLCESKQNKDDWSSPGYVAVVPLENGQPGPVVRLLEGQFHNHGFYAGRFEGKACAVTGSDAGAFTLIAPHSDQETWKVEQLTNVPTGEVWLADLDNDGVEELATLEAFHGTELKVWHRDTKGRFQVVWQYPEPLQFVHSLWMGELWGKIRGIAGSRREDAPLFLFWYENGTYCTQLIEKGASPSNVWVSRYQGKQCILAANHGQNSCVMYTNEDL